MFVFLSNLVSWPVCRIRRYRLLIIAFSSMSCLVAITLANSVLFPGFFSIKTVTTYHYSSLHQFYKHLSDVDWERQRQLSSSLNRITGSQDLNMYTIVWLVNIVMWLRIVLVWLVIKVMWLGMVPSCCFVAIFSENSSFKVASEQTTFLRQIWYGCFLQYLKITNKTKTCC